jgi:class 3 adenylate cyclase
MPLRRSVAPCGGCGRCDGARWLAGHCDGHRLGKVHGPGIVWGRPTRFVFVGATVGTATILFCDVVASTRLRATVGDVVADELRRRHDTVVAGVVESHAGTVVKHLGDGAMASFSSSADAVGAGVDLQRAVAREFGRSPEDRRIAIRVGLAAGDVVFEDGDCHGTPVVVAARLCDAAEAGQILCDDLVKGLAGSRVGFEVTSVGELELKGLGAPVSAHMVSWHDPAVIGLPLPGALRPGRDELPYAGRDAERARLGEVWKSIQTEGASLVLVAGEPGIG